MIHNSIKKNEKDIEGQDTELYKQISYYLINNFSRKKCNKCTKLNYLIRSTSTRSNSGGKIRTDLSINYRLTGETSSGSTGETRASVTPEKRIPEREKKKKSLAMYPLRKDTIPNQDKKFRTPKISMPSISLTSIFFWN